MKVGLHAPLAAQGAYLELVLAMAVPGLPLPGSLPLLWVVLAVGQHDALRLVAMLPPVGVFVLGGKHLAAVPAGSGVWMLGFPSFPKKGLSFYSVLLVTFFTGLLYAPVLEIPIFSRLGVGVATFAAGDFFR